MPGRSGLGGTGAFIFPALLCGTSVFLLQHHEVNNARERALESIAQRTGRMLSLRVTTRLHSPSADNRPHLQIYT